MPYCNISENHGWARAADVVWSSIEHFLRFHLDALMNAALVPI